jgi:hypothetical protein
VTRFSQFVPLIIAVTSGVGGNGDLMGIRILIIRPALRADREGQPSAQVGLRELARTRLAKDKE